MTRPSAIAASVAVLAVAGIGLGGYLVGRSDAPTGTDARGVTAETRTLSQASAAATARERSARRGRLDGERAGQRAGTSRGERAGASRGGVAAEREVAEVAAAELAAAAPTQCGSQQLRYEDGTGTGTLTAKGATCEEGLAIIQEHLDLVTARELGNDQSVDPTQVSGYTCPPLSSPGTTTCASGDREVSFTPDN